ncbi:hypothetical protein M9H77_18430 [Catharanthus roseus]|uniref:Uncharacterized protein n=1 Tax=Catharanthus roseus TaxID=4058 RepID=A0ACC0B7H5_CATRO|nr:hypothetical protein M9H77_18430 [Catharanthus roseus]
MTDCGLSGITRSIRLSLRLLGTDLSHEKLYKKLHGKFCKLKEQKEHEHKTTHAPMPTNHELILELSERLKKGHAYGYSVAESACLARSVPVYYYWGPPIPWWLRRAYGHHQSSDL